MKSQDTVYQVSQKICLLSSEDSSNLVKLMSIVGHSCLHLLVLKFFHHGPLTDKLKNGEGQECLLY